MNKWMNKHRTLLIRYAVTLGIGVVLALLIAKGREAAVRQLAVNDENVIMWCLSDGFFIAGFLIAAVGLLGMIATTGFFDIFGYAFSSLLVLFSPMRRPEKHRRYLEYKLEREEKRKGKMTFIFITGVLLLLAALICDLLVA